MSSRLSNKSFVVQVFLAILIGGAIVLILPLFLKQEYDTALTPAVSEVLATHEEPSFIVTHIETPENLKAIYMTSCVAATKYWRESLKDFVDETELNAIVIDIKDYSGDIAFKEDAKCFVSDLKEFIGELHESGIYVIGRITVFQDPKYTKANPDQAVRSKASGTPWKDRKGLSFVDVGARSYWDEIISLAKESYEMGFDEVNFDYIRYPSDGNMSDAEYTWTVATSTKSEMLESFFLYLYEGLKNVEVKTSADLFGLTTLASDDMGIGQILEKTLPYFDFVYPMVYPSHYAWNTGGFGDPATHPYEIIKYSMTNALLREQTWNLANGRATSTPSKLRPWIQDFDLGAEYGLEEVRAQIEATYGSGLTGWLSWDAGNRYTREAYKLE